MAKVFILYKKYLTLTGEDMTIGGIQTYINFLSQLLVKQELEVKIYQFADIKFEKEINNTTVHGVDMSGIKHEKDKKRKLFDRCMKDFNVKEDILVFACESMIVNNSITKSIAIQHGISWDVKEHENFGVTINRLYLFKKAIKANRLIKRIHKVSKLICVDYNFVNWYRSQVAHEDVRLCVIPNCTSIHQIKERNNKFIRIIFARRLVERRGTRIFANSIIPLIKKYSNIQVTIAGEGPDLNWLQNKFKDVDRVVFIKYKYDQSIQLHSEHDIAVIPTIGSEGTSLSLLEAMASKCAVIATNVGGMTNIVIDSYNGLMISPDEKQLFEAIENLIINKELRERLAENAYQMVSQAFNRDLWEERWIKVFEGILL